MVWEGGGQGLKVLALNRNVEQLHRHLSTIPLNCSDSKRSCSCATPHRLLHDLLIPQMSWGYLSALVKNFMGPLESHLLSSVVFPSEVQSAVIHNGHSVGCLGVYQPQAGLAIRIRDMDELVCLSYLGTSR
jgi:hypothetical protein